MSKKLIIIFISVVIILTVGFFGAVYYIEQKINPEDLKKIVIETIESKVKGSKASIAELNYEVGRKIYFNITELKITEIGNQKKFATLRELELKVPLLSILFGSGTIDIDIDNPIVNIYDLKNGKNNWMNALNTSKESIATTTNKTSKNTKIEIPSFIDKSRLNFRLNNLNIVKRNLRGQESGFSIEKILFKNVNFKTLTVFEILSSVKIQEAEMNISANVKVIGEFLLKDFIEDKPLKITTKVDVNNIKTSLFPNKEMVLNTELISILDQSGKLSFDLSSSFEKFFNIKTKGFLFKEKLTFSSIDLRVALAKLIRFVGVKGSSMSGGDLMLKGELDYSLASGMIVPQMSISTLNLLKADISGLTSTETRFVGDINNTALKLEVKSKLLGGDLNTKVHTSQSLNDIIKGLDGNPLYVLVEAKNFKIPKLYIQKKLKLAQNKNHNSSNKEKSIAKNSEKSVSASFPNAKVTVDLKNIVIDETILSMNSKVDIYRNLIKSEKTTLSIDKSKTALGFKTRVLKDSIASTFEVKVSDLNLRSAKTFIPFKLKDLAGTINGRASGSVKTGKELIYSVETNLDAKNGSIKKLNLKDILANFTGKLNKIIPSKKSNFSDSFDVLSVKAKATNNSIRLNDFYLEGNNKDPKLKLSGIVSMNQSNDSDLKGWLVVGSLATKLKRDYGSAQIPLYLKGKGFALKPDIKYTSSQMIKKAAKGKVRKAKKKLEKSLKEKAKKLLKGFKL